MLSFTFNIVICIQQFNLEIELVMSSLYLGPLLSLAECVSKFSRLLLSLFEVMGQIYSNGGRSVKKT